MTKLSKILRILAAAAFLTALAVNVKVSLTDPFVGMSNEAVAQTNSSSVSSNSTENTESGVPFGYYPNCGTNTFGPNGGQWAKGNRTEDQKMFNEVFRLDVSPKVSIGFFASLELARAETKLTCKLELERKLTTAYNCDNANQQCCAEVNRYAL